MISVACSFTCSRASRLCLGTPARACAIRAWSFNREEFALCIQLHAGAYNQGRVTNGLQHVMYQARCCPALPDPPSKPWRRRSYAGRETGRCGL